MKRIHYPMLFLLLALGSLALAETRQFPLEPGQTVAFDLKSGGSVTVTGWADHLAEVTVTRQGDYEKNAGVFFEETGAGLRISSEMTTKGRTSGNLHFDLMVPRDCNVDFDSMGGGLKVVDLRGRFTGKTMGGGLTFLDVEGEVKMTTMGGPIEVRNSILDGSIKTMGGRVLLQDVVGDVEASSMGGNVQYKNVRDRDGNLRVPGDLSVPGMAEDTVTITTMGGAIELDEAPAGAAVHTMGGEIHIRNAERFVKAKTMGGDIRLQVIDGWVQATTMAGDIDVVIEQGAGDGAEGITLTSYSGTITLTVPAGFSMNLDLDIAYTRNSERNYLIINDLGIVGQHTKEWETDQGSPRKHIRAGGAVAGGRYPVKIHTINGDIRIIEAD